MCCLGIGFSYFEDTFRHVCMLLCEIFVGVYFRFRERFPGIVAAERILFSFDFRTVPVLFRFHIGLFLGSDTLLGGIPFPHYRNSPPSVSFRAIYFRSAPSALASWLSKFDALPFWTEN